MSVGTSELNDVFAPLSVRAMQTIFATPSAWWVSFSAILTLLIFPLFLTDVPPLLDYPNHLARVFVLANGGEDPALSRMYAPHWTVIPNLAFDGLGLLLLQVVPIHVAGRILVGLSVVLPVIGLVVYARVISGVRSYWPLGVGLLAYNALLLLGFLNLQIGLGVAFISAAIWHSGQQNKSWRSVVVVAVLAVVTFFCHIVGLVFLAILLFAAEAPGARTWHGMRTVGIAVARLVFVFATPALLYLSTDLAADNSATIWVGLLDKVSIILQPFLNYDWRLDLATAAIVVAVVYAGAVTRAGTISRPAGIALLIAMTLFFVTPKVYKSGTYFDSRFLLLALFLLFACYVPKRTPSVLAVVTGCVIGMLFIVRMLILTYAWTGHNVDVSELRHAISTVEPGSRVLVVTVGPGSVPEYWEERKRRAGVIDGFLRTDSHMPGLLVIERSAFWPLMFAVRNQHPIDVLPPYNQISVGSGLLPEYGLLNNPFSEEAHLFPYLEQWDRRFDYVLVLNSGAAPELAHFLPEKLQLADVTKMASLFRIKR